MLSCVTIKSGKTCVFMKKRGCSYNGGRCQPVVESCNGCANVEELGTGRYCRVFAEPVLKWNLGKCPMATHIQDTRDSEAPVKKVNPLKASKRSAR